MGADGHLSGYTIPNPCAMNWDEMNGDTRERFCAACGKHVHDLTAMRPEGVRPTCFDMLTMASLLPRLYSRADGSTHDFGHCRVSPLAADPSVAVHDSLHHGGRRWCGGGSWRGRLFELFAGSRRKTPAPAATGPRLLTLQLLGSLRNGSPLLISSRGQPILLQTRSPRATPPDVRNLPTGY